MNSQRLLTIALIIVYCFSVIGWSDYDLSVKSGCRCSEKAQSDNACCCSAKGNQRAAEATKSRCCSSSKAEDSSNCGAQQVAKSSCCSSSEKPEGPVVSSCSCGGEKPQGFVVVSDPRSLFAAVSVVSDKCLVDLLLFPEVSFLNDQLPPETPPPRA